MVLINVIVPINSFHYIITFIYKNIYSGLSKVLLDTFTLYVSMEHILCERQYARNWIEQCIRHSCISEDFNLVREKENYTL